MQYNNSREARYCAVLSIMLIPTFAYANAGTPLVWAHITYLAFSNIIIAIIEAFFIYKRLHLVNRHKTVLVLLIANYLSAFSGIFLHFAYMRLAKIDWDPLGYGSADEFHLEIIFLIMSYFISLIIEFPIIRFFLDSNSKLLKVLRVVVEANLITYMLLALQYLVMCNPKIMM